MATIKFNKGGSTPEKSIHLAFMKWVKLYRQLDRFVLHFPNESKRTATYGKLLKDMGMRKGVADLLIAMPRHDYAGAWIEIKNEKGRLSKEQEFFLMDMATQGYLAVMTRGLDETINLVEWYCFSVSKEMPEVSWKPNISEH
jgi:hypothetical protein